VVFNRVRDKYVVIANWPRKGLNFRYKELRHIELLDFLSGCKLYFYDLIRISCKIRYSFAYGKPIKCLQIHPINEYLSEYFFYIAV
jgi:hypothetical protein